jgi:hypothetical protein
MSTADDGKKGLSSDEMASGVEDPAAMFKLILEKLNSIDALDAKVVDIGRCVNNHQAVLERLQSSQENNQGQNSAQFNHDVEMRGTPKLHKPDFPKFDGKGDPLSFIHRCEQFFRGYRVLEEEKVWMASIHLLDAAHIWYMHIERDNGTQTWRCFTELLNLRFGPPLRANPLGDLATCHRTRSVEDYSKQFLSLLAHAGTLTESQQVQLFTVGLRPPMSINVQIQAPQSLEVAMNLAEAYEVCEQVVRVSQQQRMPHSTYQQGVLPTPSAPLPLPAPPTKSMAPCIIWNASSTAENNLNC